MATKSIIVSLKRQEWQGRQFSSQKPTQPVTAPRDSCEALLCGEKLGGTRLARVMIRAMNVLLWKKGRAVI
eukprot:scaffold568479_cov24-Prasinocladus_malaysianus.AAC.1